ncbi:hypothetical protein B0A55_13441, partial [Friedmanniomyces simplex]
MPSSQIGSWPHEAGLHELHQRSLQQEAALKGDTSSRFVSGHIAKHKAPLKEHFDNVKRDKMIA